MGCQSRCSRGLQPFSVEFFIINAASGWRERQDISFPTSANKPFDCAPFDSLDKLWTGQLRTVRPGFAGGTDVLLVMQSRGMRENFLAIGCERY